MRRVTILGPALALAMGSSTAGARPIGWSPPGGHAGAGPEGGALLGVEGAWTTTLADPGGSQDAWGFGVRAGYGFANGLELHLRYDDLGIAPLSSGSPLQLATGGLRYTVPILFPMPFAEVDAGPAFVLGDVRFGVGAQLGLSIPVVNHVLVDVSAHDWFVPIQGTTWQTLTVGLGLTITFGGPR